MTLTPAQAVAIDALREAFDEATVERMVAAIEPGSVLLASTVLRDWQRTRSPAFGPRGDVHPDAATLMAVPRADFRLIELIRAVVEH